MQHLRDLKPRVTVVCELVDLVTDAQLLTIGLVTAANATLTKESSSPELVWKMYSRLFLHLLILLSSFCYVFLNILRTFILNKRQLCRL